MADHAERTSFVENFGAALMNLCYAVRDGAPGEAHQHAVTAGECVQAALPAHLQEAPTETTEEHQPPPGLREATAKLLAEISWHGDYRTNDDHRVLRDLRVGTLREVAAALNGEADGGAPQEGEGEPWKLYLIGKCGCKVWVVATGREDAVSRWRLGCDDLDDEDEPDEIALVADDDDLIPPHLSELPASGLWQAAQQVLRELDEDGEIDASTIGRLRAAFGASPAPPPASAAPPGEARGLLEGALDNLSAAANAVDHHTAQADARIRRALAALDRTGGEAPR